MKHSIRSIFKSLTLTLTLTTFLSIFISLLVLEYNLSYQKIQNLKNQKHIISTLTNLKKDDIELALIQFNGKSTQLLNEIDKLRKANRYDYTGTYLFHTSQEYLNDLDKLSSLTKKFNETAKLYYTDELNKDKADEEFKKKQLENAFYNINHYIDTIMLKDIKYKEIKFHLLEKLSISLTILLLLTTIWYAAKLRMIHKDILFLYSVDKNKKNHEIATQEADAISMRMKRKPSTSENPDMLDPVTEINNVKGMKSSYAEKRKGKSNGFTSVTVFEVDSFSKTNRAFSQEFTQAVLKKIAFTISLHEQATDIIARTDYNQFTVILSRATKEQLFKDIDIIRQTIAETKFTTPEKKNVQITISGGFAIKTNNSSLDDAIKKANEILKHAQQSGGNRVSQIRDIVEQDFR